ncbi:MAG TPA: hypothetical protein VIV60_07690 [Polyangiaceae bacterium]
MSQDIQSVVTFPGVQGTSVGPLIRVPAGYGAWTITKAYIVNDAAATFTAYLDDLGTALGTAQSATIGTSTVANGTFVANVQKALNLVASPVVNEGHWLGLYVSAGATLAGTRVLIEYAVGK